MHRMPCFCPCVNILSEKEKRPLLIRMVSNILTLTKLHTSMVFSMHTPTGLLNKVWFELCLHFCRRGRENQRELTPQRFAIETDNLRKRYICQIRSEVTKNHQGLSSVNTDSKTVRMYETTTDNCPVKKFCQILVKATSYV